MASVPWQLAWSGPLPLTCADCQLDVGDLALLRVWSDGISFCPQAICTACLIQAQCEQDLHDAMLAEGPEFCLRCGARLGPDARIIEDVDEDGEPGHYTVCGACAAAATVDAEAATPRPSAQRRPPTPPKLRCQNLSDGTAEFDRTHDETEQPAASPEQLAKLQGDLSPLEGATPERGRRRSRGSANRAAARARASAAAEADHTNVQTITTDVRASTEDDSQHTYGEA